jgi:hypothetical protein
MIFSIPVYWNMFASVVVCDAGKEKIQKRNKDDVLLVKDFFRTRRVYHTVHVKHDVDYSPRRYKEERGFTVWPYTVRIKDHEESEARWI